MRIAADPRAGDHHLEGVGGFMRGLGQTLGRSLKHAMF
jgi:hypothetical protein